MKILLTNDDGIFAPGLAALHQELRSLGEVTVVAPESEQSAVGHAISLISPLRVKKVSLGQARGWAVSGTPADCVKIAIAELLKETPDLVVSGINLGPNVGINVLYSGTVSAATEASILGIRGMALSLNSYREDADFHQAAVLTRELAAQLLEWPGWSPEICLNVNLPDLDRDRIKGVKITRQDTGPLVEHFERRVDPREHLYYWLAEINARRDLDASLDYGALAEGYITITPLRHDLTDYPALKALKGLNWQ